MISIVVHGILCTSYSQIVVESAGLSGNHNQEVLHDIRRQLSTEYGDATPMTGWALQPAPDGIWLSRIERAFDANYAPAYVMVSFLIPQGNRVAPNALTCIEHCMVANHAKYMRQNVIQYDAEWGFLDSLGRDLEHYLENEANVIEYHWKPTEGSAYWTIDMVSMLGEIWDARIRQFNIVYCGNQILSTDKEFVAIEDVVSPIDIGNVQEPSAPSSNPLHEEPLSTKETVKKKAWAKPRPDEKTIKDLPKDDHSIIDLATILASIDSKAKDREGDKTKSKKHNPPTKATNQNTKRGKPTQTEKKNHDTIKNILVLIGIAIVIYLIYFFLHRSSNNNTDYYLEDTISELEELVDSLNAEEYAVDSMTVTVEEAATEKIPIDTVITKDDMGKTNIFSASELFLCQTWKNVENNGKLFHEKYEVTNSDLEQRVNDIVTKANKIGEARFVEGYAHAKKQTELDCLDDLEKYLRICIEIDIYNELIKQGAKEQAPKFGLG